LKKPDVIDLYHDNAVSAEITIETKVVPIQLSNLNDSFGG